MQAADPVLQEWIRRARGGGAGQSRTRPACQRCSHMAPSSARCRSMPASLCCLSLPRPRPPPPAGATSMATCTAPPGWASARSSSSRAPSWPKPPCPTSCLGMRWRASGAPLLPPLAHAAAASHSGRHTPLRCAASACCKLKLAAVCTPAHASAAACRFGNSRAALEEAARLAVSMGPRRSEGRQAVLQSALRTLDLVRGGGHGGCD